MRGDLAIEPGIEFVVGHCDNCGHESRLFRGFIYAGGETYGVYACHYTDSHPELGVSMAVSLYGWGEGVDETLKVCVALEWLNAESGPGCRVVDAKGTSWAKEPSLGCMLSREEALETGRATEAFNVTDAVWLNDLRLAHALDGS